MASKKRHSAVAACLPAAVLACAIPVLGQEEGQPQPGAQGQRKIIEEVYVTAQKREQALVEVPMSVTAITGEILSEMGAEGVQDIAFATPSFTVSETGPGSQNFQIRGISSVAGRSTVGYYLDDVVLSALVSPIIQPDTDLYDLARVEVLRGPQGTLYGEGSMGGTLRLITSSPSAQEWEAELHMSYDDSPDRGDPSKDVDGVLNIPLWEDLLALRVVGSYKESGGFIDFPALGRKNGNSGEKRSARAKLLFTPTERLTLSGMVLEHHSKADSMHVADSDFEFPGRIPQTAEDDYVIYSASADYSFDFMNVLLTASRFDRQSLAVSDLSHSTLPGMVEFNPLIDPITRELITSSFDEVPFLFDTDALIDVGELRLTSRNTERWFWTVGTFIKDAYQEQLAFSEARSSSTGGLPTQPTVSVIDGVQSVDTRSLSVFGQVEWFMTKKLSLAVGARRFEEDLTAAFVGTGVGLDATHYDETHFTSTNPRVSVNYNFVDGGDWLDYGMVYASWSTGFRSGGANIRTTSGVDEIPALYDPENLTTQEVGAKVIGAENRWSVEVALYHNDWEDIQIYQDFNGFNGIANQGKAEADGIDWSLGITPIERVSFLFSGNYNRSVFAEDTSDKNKGDQIDFVPELTASLGVMWAFNWTTNYPGSLRVDFNYQQGTVFQRRSDDLLLESDALHILNARLGLIQRPQWQLSLYGRNLLNEDGKADTISQSQVGEAYAARLRPIYFGVDIRWQLF